MSANEANTAEDTGLIEPERPTIRVRLSWLLSLLFLALILSLFLGRYPGPYFTTPEVLFENTLAQRLALNRISVEIPQGAVTAILGPNGSGKSTLLYLLLGLLKPEEGDLTLLGCTGRQHTRRDMSRIIGLVPQEEHVPFDLSVLEYVLLGRAPFLAFLGTPGSDDRRAARQALVTTGIASLEHRSVPSLSGGERQLATVARALAQEPAILLLDEPTSHLDLANARRILKVLRSLRESGKTIVLTTHDPNAAAAVADCVILLREGRITTSGPASGVLASEHLSSTYGVKVEVLMVRDRPMVLTHVLQD